MSNVRDVLFGRFLEPFIAFLIVVIIARLLTVAELGYYSLLISMLYILIVVVGLGMSESILYFLPKNKNIVGDVIFIQSAVFMVFAVGFLLMSPMIQTVYGLSAESIVVVTVGVFLGMMFRTMYYVLNAKSMFKRMMWSSIMLKFSRVSVTVPLLLLLGGYFSAILGELVGWVLPMFVLLYWLQGVKLKRTRMVKRVLKYSFLIYVTNLSVLLVINFASLYVGTFNIEWVAFIGMGAQGGPILILPGLSVAAVFMPEFSKGRTELLRLASRWTLISTVLMWTVVVPNLDFLIDFVFTERYSGATLTVALYMLAFGVMGLNIVISNLFLGTNKVKFNAASGIIQLVVAIVAVVLLIPIGPHGAGVGIIISQITGLIFYLTVLKMKRFKFAYTSALKTVMAGVAGYSTTFLVMGGDSFLGLLLKVLLGAGTYLILLGLMGEADTKDIKLVLRQMF
jgi:O-antigen/teichoic acid export membrane protein